jgi:uncharacterized membrane protein
MDDVDLEHEWQPDLEVAVKEPSGATQVGTRKSYISSFMGKRVANTYVVEELGPGWRVVYSSTPDSTVDASTEITCEETPAGSRVTMSVTANPKGALRFIPKALMEKAAKDQLEATLRRLKKCVERIPE